MHRDLPGDLAETVQAADRLEADGDLVGALDLLVAGTRGRRTPDLLTRLVDLRHRAVGAHPTAPREPWPPAFDDPFPEIRGRVPEIARSELTSEVMGATIAHHGSILVRGLLDHDQVERTRSSVVRATDARAADPGARDPLAYAPSLGIDHEHNVLRTYVARSNGVWLADSPAGLAQVLGDLTDAGVIDAVSEHFGERPVMSLEKSTLRRNSPEFRFASWHQDGSFLGRDTRAFNVWVALTACGGTRPAPGLQLVADRVGELLPAEGGTGRASIDGYALRYFVKAHELTIDVPEFEPGDALLFDELMAHRTYLTEGMTEERLALECWFFAPSRPADEYLSLLV